MELTNYLETPKASTSNPSGHIKDYIMWDHVQFLFLFYFCIKTKNPRFYGLKKHFFGYPTLQPLGSFSHMIGSRSSLKITRKMKFIQEK
jgi:hypothetical protein